MKNGTQTTWQKCTDLIRDNNRLSISRMLKCSAMLLFVYAGVFFAKSNPEMAVLTFGALVLGHPITSACASYIGKKKDEK